MDCTLDNLPNDAGRVPTKEHELKSLQITTQGDFCVKREIIELTESQNMQMSWPPTRKKTNNPIHGVALV